MMYYSIEDIYKYSGQFDKTVTVSFLTNSESFKKYSSFVSGTFFYTPAERQQLHDIIKQEDYERNNGFVKIEISYSKNLSTEQIDELKYGGINTSDISEILQFNEPVENEYSKTDLRRLPDPIKIQVDFSDTDEEEMFLWLNNSRLENGYKLIPSDINRHNGIILRKYEGIISPSDLENFKDPETGEIKDKIRFEYLKSKFLKDLINDEEVKELREKTGSLLKQRIEILKKELTKSSEKFKEIGINYQEGLALIMHLTTRFEDEQLNAAKFPIWWDYERFIHIYMRHVKETQIGDRFEKKTVFQYKLKDIMRLVKRVLEKIESEVQEHFTNTPDKEFRRIGNMSIYYNGDYYEIQIAPGGRLMRFHKK